MSSRSPVARGFIAELDGLRGIAILLVVVHRFWPRTGVGVAADAAGAGWIGVDLFFVISGFLITGILLDTRGEPGFFRNFYVRRMLRIFPLYYLFVGSVLLVFWSNAAFRYHAGSPLWYLAHLGNVPEGLLDHDVPYWLAPVWSLAIEEQFYLTFPLLVYLLDRRRLTIALIAMVVAAPLIRLATMLAVPDQERIQYLFTLCRIDAIAVGCLLAVAIRAIDVERWRARGVQVAAAAVAGAIVIGAVTGLDRTTGFGRVLGYSGVAVGCAGVVALVVLGRDARATSPLRWAPLTYLGKLCFGLYLLHRPADTLVSAVADRVGIDADLRILPLKLALAIVLATISWRLIERPFLGLKAAFASANHPGASRDAPLGPRLPLVSRVLRLLGVAVVLLVIASCNRTPASAGSDARELESLQDGAPGDGGVADGGVPDSGLPDSGPPDSGVPDSGVPDSGLPDSGVTDSGVTDSGVADGGVRDSGLPDSGVPDSGVPDSGVPDSGPPDSGVPDGGVADGGVRDGGLTDGAPADSALADARVPADAAPGPDGGTQVGTALYPEGPRHSPITPATVARLQAIAATAAHRDDVFAKVGDSITASTDFLGCFDGGTVALGAYGLLSSTLAYFLGGDAAGRSPFARTSIAAVGGWTAGEVLAGSPSALDRELAAVDPRLAIVMFGTNEVRYGVSVDAFGEDLWTVVDRALRAGIIPLMSTIPPMNGYPAADARIPTFNRVVRAIAQGRGVPLVDYHRALVPLPSRGLSADQLHPSTAPGGACVLTDAGLQFGYNVRNLVTLEALARIRGALAGAATDASGPVRRGTGTAADPILATLPLVDLRDTRTGDALLVTYACGGLALAGREIRYQLDLSAAMTLDAYVVDRGSVDVDVLILAGSAAASSCVARGDEVATATVGPGRVVIVVDTPAASGEGEYALVVSAR